jgi:hypothetical protein
MQQESGGGPPALVVDLIKLICWIAGLYCLYGGLLLLGVERADIYVVHIAFVWFAISQVVRFWPVITSAVEETRKVDTQGPDFSWDGLRNYSVLLISKQSGNWAVILVACTLTGYAFHWLINGEPGPFLFCLFAAALLFGLAVLYVRLKLRARIGAVVKLVQGLPRFTTPTLTFLGALAVLGFLPERLAGTTTRSLWIYVAVGAAAVTLGVSLLIAGQWLTYKIAATTISATSKFCRHTKRFLRLDSDALPIIRWFEIQIHTQLVGVSALGMALSAIVYNFSRSIEGAYVFAVVIFLATIGPLAGVVIRASEMNRRVLYQVPKCFFFFLATSSAVFSLCFLVFYMVNHGLAAAFVYLRRELGVAVVPDFLYFFFREGLTEAILWKQIEGTAIGALCAFGASWLAVVIIKRDWIRLAFGIALAMSGPLISEIFDLFENDILSSVEPHLSITPTLLISVLLPTIVISLSTLALKSRHQTQKCVDCGEIDIVEHARYCPTCGHELDRPS